MDWSRVTEQHDDIIIIGGGESLEKVDLEQLNDFPGAIITVNNVIFHIPRADYWMTVDPMTEDLQPQPGCVEQFEGTKYYCAYPDLEKTPHDKPFYRQVEGVHYLERIIPEPDEKTNYQLQEDKSKITTGDSIYGSIGLAYHMGAKRIVLLGVDGYGFGHWYDKKDPYNLHGVKDFKANYLDNIPPIYRSSVEQLAKAGVVTINGSKHSIVDCYKRTTPQQAINWIKGEVDLDEI